MCVQSLDLPDRTAAVSAQVLGNFLAVLLVTGRLLLFRYDGSRLTAHSTAPQDTATTFSLFQNEFLSVCLVPVAQRVWFSARTRMISYF